MNDEELFGGIQLMSVARKIHGRLAVMPLPGPPSSNFSLPPSDKNPSELLAPFQRHHQPQPKPWLRQQSVKVCPGNSLGGRELARGRFGSLPAAAEQPRLPPGHLLATLPASPLPGTHARLGLSPHFLGISVICHVSSAGLLI